MRVAVVIPVGPESNSCFLMEAIQSVLDQSTEATPVLVFDGKPAETYYFASRIIRVDLPRPSADIGSTPRAIGSVYAFGQGFDAVCWLDADNVYKPEHVERLVSLHRETGMPVVASGRHIMSVDGRHRAPCVEQQPLSGFFDTNTLMVTRAAYDLAVGWGKLPKEAHIIGDRIIAHTALEMGMACHYEPTVLYRSTWEFHYNINQWPKEGLNLK